MLSPVETPNKSSQQSTAGPKPFSLPKPLSALNAFNSHYSKLRQPVSDHKKSPEFGFSPLDNKIVLDYETTANDLEGILEKVKKLRNSDELANLNTIMNVNIFYKPVIKFDRVDPDASVVNKNSGDVKLSDKVITEVSNNLSKVLFDSQIIQNHKSTEIQLFDKVNKVNSEIPVFEINQNSSETDSKDPKETPARIKSYSDPVKFTKVSSNEEIGLKKRDQINYKCKCENLPYNSKYENLAVINQHAIKLRRFWKGKNSAYPFVYKKREVSYYDDSDEASVVEILDFSKRVIVNEDLILGVKR